MKLGEQYETGVLWQDFQHGQLIDLFEKIKEAKADQTDKNLYQYTVAFLAMYVNHHFKLEEQYMKKYEFPDASEHVKEHQAFIKELKEFRSIAKEYTEEASDKLLTRIGEWILSHILDVDQQLGKYILNYEKKHGV